MPEVNRAATAESLAALNRRLAERLRADLRGPGDNGAEFIVVRDPHTEILMVVPHHAAREKMERVNGPASFEACIGYVNASMGSYATRCAGRLHGNPAAPEKPVVDRSAAGAGQA